MYNIKKQLPCSNNLSLEMKKKLIKSCIWGCCCLWIRNTDRREKWREGHKCIWNMELERNVKNKMDGQNNEWWSFWKGERRKITFKNFKPRGHSWIGHTVRHSEFVVNILEGATSGKKRAVGKPRLQYLQQFARNTGAESYTAMKRVPCNNSIWKAANQSK